MRKRKNSDWHGDRSGSRKYIVGSIAAVLVIIAAIAVAAWVICKDLNPSDQDKNVDQEKAAAQQETEEKEHEESKGGSSEAEDENSGATDSEIEKMLASGRWGNLFLPESAGS